MRFGCFTLLLVLGALPHGGAAAQQAPTHCDIAGFRGMTQPGGTQTTMRVVNTGEPCRITFWMTADRQPYEAARASEAPTQGTVTVTATGAAYTPRAGFTGTDRFTIVASGTSSAGRQFTGQVVVAVTVLPR